MQPDIHLASEYHTQTGRELVLIDFHSFLLDPGMYDYFNSTWQRNEEAPENYPGQHILDVNSEKAYGFLEDAIKADKPFFLAVAPVAPHAQVLFSLDDPNNRTISPPVPQTQYNNSFPDAKVPRTPNFNPDQVSLALSLLHAVSQ